MFLVGTMVEGQGDVEKERDTQRLNPARSLSSVSHDLSNAIQKEIFNSPTKCSLLRHGCMYPCGQCQQAQKNSQTIKLPRSLVRDETIWSDSKLENIS